ncbi:MAG: DeoR/GlpR family DNA-binding transcription regulator [Eubacteriales bacterium]|nr:DeoR/GlpR family DNA-binding transcription regulator [Eubacteriales bacterium]
MLSEERFSRIAAFVNAKRSVTVTELVEKLKVSESTIRRDLIAMDEKGLLVKVHGGAIALDFDTSTKDEDVLSRQSMNTEAKRKIARYAASLIRPGDFVYLDAGTTTELMIDYIEAKTAVFVTDAVTHAGKLAAMGIRVHILGGELKSITEAVVGEEAIASLQKYNFTRGFWGVNAISTGAGLTTPDLQEAMVKTHSMLRCREKYVLADVSKFQKISNVTFAALDDALILTDKTPPAEYARLENVVVV